MQKISYESNDFKNGLYYRELKQHYFSIKLSFPGTTVHLCIFLEVSGICIFSLSDYCRQEYQYNKIAFKDKHIFTHSNIPKAADQIYSRKTVFITNWHEKESRKKVLDVTKVEYFPEFSHVHSNILPLPLNRVTSSDFQKVIITFQV